MPQSDLGTSTAMRELQDALLTLPGPGTFATRFSTRFNYGTTAEMRVLLPALNKLSGAQSFAIRPSVRFSFGPTAEMRQLPPSGGGGDNIIIASWEDDLVAQFAMQAIPITRTTFYTVPEDRDAIVRCLEILNTSAAAISVDIWLDGVPWEKELWVPAHDKFKDLNMITEIGPDSIFEWQASGTGAYGWLSGVLQIHDPEAP